MSLHDNAWDIRLRHRARRLTRELVPGFVAVLPGLAVTRTAPTFDRLTTVLTGGVFARRHTITRRILAAGDVARKHCSSSAAKHRRASRTRPELAVEMLTLLCHHRKPRHFHVVADSAYGGQSVLCHLPTNCDLTSRLLKDARVYAAPPERTPETNGRPRRRDERLPTPSREAVGALSPRDVDDLRPPRTGSRRRSGRSRVRRAASSPARGGRGSGSRRTRTGGVLLHLLGRDRRTDPRLVRDALEHRSQESRQQTTPGLRGTTRLDPPFGRTHGTAGDAAVPPDRVVVRPRRSS